MHNIRRACFHFAFGAATSWHAAIAGISTACAADPVTRQVEAKSPRFEWSAGFQGYEQVWSLYSGITAAPFGGIQADGARLRLSGGYGGYRYSGPRAFGTGSQAIDFEGTVVFADFLLGYQKQAGPVTLKLFGGLMAEEHQVRPDDPETSIRGMGVGGKVVLEAWWTVNDRLWASADLAWGSVHNSYGGRIRLGWRLAPNLSAGLETGVAGNVEGDVTRAGAFLRYEWAAGELSISGGVSSDQLFYNLGVAKASDSSTPFVSAGWLTRF